MFAEIDSLIMSRNRRLPIPGMSLLPEPSLSRPMSPDLCANMRFMMRRFRALLLLMTLLATPVSVIAASVFPLPECCTSDTMCPMHRDQDSRQGKAPCHGTDQSRPTCACRSSHQSPSAVPQSAPKATMDHHVVLMSPAITREVELFDSALPRIRFVSPPEQPPRS